MDEQKIAVALPVKVCSSIRLMTERRKIEEIRQKHESLQFVFDERTRRLWAAIEARSLGRGGISHVCEATGLGRPTIYRALEEIKELEHLPSVPGNLIDFRVRRKGAGRKRTVELDPDLKIDLERLIDSTSRGDPMSPLRWTCKSVRRLSDDLKQMGHSTNHQMVAELLAELGYSLQANQKTIEGAQHPDRNAQFEYISQKVEEYRVSNDPIISVDTKKKELIGDYKNGGRELRPKGNPETVKVHDFIDPNLGRGIPYGVYDLTANSGWVSVGIDHDTSTFAVESIRRWWLSMGSPIYPNARRLLITADGGGSNGSRIRLWKIEIQRLADQLAIPISVCHFPPGTSKWNKIEHKLFSFITLNWRGKPLVSHEVMVKLISATTTRTGLKVQSQLDTGSYPTGRKITKREIEALNIDTDKFHGEWNYTIKPSQQTEV
jgi:hypothetical protein